jgi:hypothetical protein
MEWCVKDLETKYTQLLLTNGSYYESLPGKIEGAIVEQYAGQTAENIEKAIWQGDTTSVDNALKHFDGLIKIVGAASGVVNANSTAYISAVATSLTAANIISVMQAVNLAIPVQLLDKTDLAVFVGVDVARLYQNALTNANLYNYTANADGQGEFYIVGTNIKVIPVNGLNGTSKIYAGRTSNIFVGVDMEDEDQFKMWYSEDFDVVRFKAEFKYGTQIAIPSEIVKFTV